MLAKWEEMDLYGEMLKKNEGKPRFSLHDGPPFSNGNIHMGTAMNKALKDFIVRMYAMRGRYTPYVPGWDNHGMPHRVRHHQAEQAQPQEDERAGVPLRLPRLRPALCGRADGVLQAHRRGGGLDHPYLTMNPGFEARR